MGLTTWKNAPAGKILKSDILLAKNYLGKKHVKELELIVSAYLDLAENRTNRKIIMKMSDWANFLNQFLELSATQYLSTRERLVNSKPKLNLLKNIKSSVLNRTENIKAILI